MEILYNTDGFSAVDVFSAEGDSGMGSKETFFMKPKVDFCFKELMQKLSLSLETAEGYMEKYWKPEQN